MSEPDIAVEPPPALLGRASIGTRERPVRVLCLGGGHAAFRIAQGLARSIRAGRVELTVISRDNFHVFHGFVHEMITCKVQPSQIISPARRIFPPAKFHNAEIEKIDLAGRQVTTSRLLDGRQFVLPFDHLVLAVGSVDDLSRYAGMAEHGHMLKTYWGCFKTRNQLISILEMAEFEQDPLERQRLLTVAVAGGNVGGVEVATEINDFLRALARKEYRGIRPEEIRIVLVNGSDRILPEFQTHHLPLVEWAERHLAKSGIEIRLNTRVAAATGEEVVLSTGERLPTRTIISCTGTAASPLLAQLGLPQDERGRLIVNEHLQVPGRTDLWAAGDCAAVPHPEGGICPPLGIFAQTAGRQIARNIVATIDRRPLEPYRFTGLGDAVSLGRHSAIGQLNGFRVSGLTAWIAWRLMLFRFVPCWDRRIRLLFDWIVGPLVGRDIVNIKMDEPYGIQRELFEAGQIIVQQGDIGRKLYLVWSGEVDVLRATAEGSQHLTTLGPGSHFGEVAVFEGSHRTATVLARTRVELISLSRKAATVLSTAMPSFGGAVRQSPAQRGAAPVETATPAG